VVHPVEKSKIQRGGLSFISFIPT